ncbi:hypothetical protein [Mycobacterium sp. NPDC050041]|uniref:hypothetical protein n=1 Tax=Mycobacterium sp. NPDC050041 TaxID=3364293 RepID=UPI003C2D0CF4
MDALRRLLARELTVAGWLELGMWLAIPYLAIGIGFTFLQPEFARLAELRLQATLPAGANLVAFGESVLYWPVLLFAPEVCAAV